MKSYFTNTTGGKAGAPGKHKKQIRRSGKHNTKWTALRTKNLQVLPGNQATGWDGDRRKGEASNRMSRSPPEKLFPCVWRLPTSFLCFASILATNLSADAPQTSAAHYCLLLLQGLHNFLYFSWEFLSLIWFSLASGNGRTVCQRKWGKWRGWQSMRRSW